MGMELIWMFVLVLVGSRIVTLYEGFLDLRFLLGNHLVLSLVSGGRFIALRLPLGRKAELVRIFVGVWLALWRD